MAPENEHPDRETLSSWLSFSLPEDAAAEIEKHLSDCQPCAEILESLSLESGRRWEERLRAISRGDVEDQAGRTQETFDLTGDGDRAVTLAWEGVGRSGDQIGRTVKGNAQRQSTQHPLDVPLKKRALHTKTDASPTPTAESNDYQLLDIIGEGGMGVVYSAVQPSVDRIVAVKMLSKDKSDPQRRRLFLQEAMVTANLDHPNIVPVHELGRNELGGLFYSMKQVSGKSWDDTIDSLSQRENVELLIRIADAVAFAHSRGILHRDLKPENVMVGEFGEVWLMDWGLAQPTADYRKPELAKTRQMGGTPAYMAPEMTKPDGDVGPWSDVYLLGAILFQIVAGSPPHFGESVMGCLLAAGRNKIIETNRKSELLPIAYKAMATDPKERYASVAEFKSAMLGWVSHAESLAIAAKANELAQQAKTSQRYQDYIRSVFGFEQACALNPDNHEASRMLSQVKVSYAECAARKGDFDLAAGLLDERDDDHAELLTRVRTAKADQAGRLTRAQRQQTAFRFFLAATLALMIGGVLVTSWLRASALQLANANEPAMYASMSLQSGLRRSFGALRGWVALGDPEFKQARASAWKDEIRPSLKTLASLVESVDSEEARDKLAELTTILNDLDEEQWWIEDVAQTPGNEPADDLLWRDIGPIESEIALALQALVDREAEKSGGEATPEVWLPLSRMRLEFTDSHRRLVDAIDTGDVLQIQRFRETFAQLLQTHQAIALDPRGLDQEQRHLVVWLRGELTAYHAMAIDALQKRQSPQANVALWRLRTQALPHSSKAEAMLAQVIVRNRQFTVDNSNQINRISMIAIIIGSALAIGIGIAVWLSAARDRGARRETIVFSLLLAWGLAMSGEAGAQTTSSPTPRLASTAEPGVTSGDVFARVRAVRDELELIRSEMGKPAVRLAPMAVTDAAPHEVFFQALTMFQKTDQLCFEHLRDRRPLPQRPDGTVRPADVLVVVDAVMARLGELKVRYGIEERHETVPSDASKVPSDVFASIVQANRQLNLLVDRRVTAADVYQQVTLAVSYSSAILGAFPGADSLPDEPEFVRRKTPVDVFRRLGKCYQDLRDIAAKSGVKMLRCEISEEDILSAGSDDVYDIAALIVSELAHLHSLHGNLRPVKRVFSPGHRFPAHVFQRAGMLEQQIGQLQALCEENADWLEGGSQ